MNKNLRNALAGLAVTAAAVLSTAACTHGGANAQQQEQAQQNADTQSLENSQPLPHYQYSQIRQTLIDAQTMEADGTQTTSLFFLNGIAKPIFTCPSLGEPVANTDQLSNPEQIAPISGKYGGGATNLPQMDPNGIYTGSSSQGTYVLCVNGGGKPYLQYWEGPVMTVGAGAVWDDAKSQVEVNGAPTAEIHVGTTGSSVNSGSPSGVSAPASSQSAGAIASTGALGGPVAQGQAGLAS